MSQPLLPKWAATFLILPRANDIGLGELFKHQLSGHFLGNEFALVGVTVSAYPHPLLIPIAL